MLFYGAEALLNGGDGGGASVLELGLDGSNRSRSEASPSPCGSVSQSLRSGTMAAINVGHEVGAGWFDDARSLLPVIATMPINAESPLDLAALSRRGSAVASVRIASASSFKIGSASHSR